MLACQTMSHAPGGLILCWPEMVTIVIEFLCFVDRGS